MMKSKKIMKNWMKKIKIVAKRLKKKIIMKIKKIINC